jgi:hypothetical protein
MADVLAVTVNGFFIIERFPVSFEARRHNDTHFAADLRNRADETQSRRKTMAYDDYFLFH